MNSPWTIFLLTASATENSDHPDAEYVRVSLYSSVENIIQRGRKTHEVRRNVRQGEPHNCALHQILLGRYQQVGWVRHTARSAEMRSTCDSWGSKKSERPGRRFKGNNNILQQQRWFSLTLWGTYVSHVRHVISPVIGRLSTMREERKLRVFENKVLRNKFGSKTR
jgi:hypothetical protein